MPVGSGALYLYCTSRPRHQCQVPSRLGELSVLGFELFLLVTCKQRSLYQFLLEPSGQYRLIPTPAPPLLCLLSSRSFDSIQENLASGSTALSRPGRPDLRASARAQPAPTPASILPFSYLVNNRYQQWLDVECRSLDQADGVLC